MTKCLLVPHNAPKSEPRKHFTQDQLGDFVLLKGTWIRVTYRSVSGSEEALSPKSSIPSWLMTSQKLHGWRHTFSYPTSYNLVPTKIINPWGGRTEWWVPGEHSWPSLPPSTKGYKQPYNHYHRTNYHYIACAFHCYKAKHCIGRSPW